MCNKVKARIACEKCGYPYSESRYPDDWDNPLPCDSDDDRLSDYITNVKIGVPAFGEEVYYILKDGKVIVGKVLGVDQYPTGALITVRLFGGGLFGVKQRDISACIK